MHKLAATRVTESNYRLVCFHATRRCGRRSSTNRPRGRETCEIVVENRFEKSAVNRRFRLVCGFSTFTSLNNHLSCLGIDKPKQRLRDN